MELHHKSRGLIKSNVVLKASRDLVWAGGLAQGPTDTRGPLRCRVCGGGCYATVSCTPCRRNSVYQLPFDLLVGYIVFARKKNIPFRSFLAWGSVGERILKVGQYFRKLRPKIKSGFFLEHGVCIIRSPFAIRLHVIYVRGSVDAGMIRHVTK